MTIRRINLDNLDATLPPPLFSYNDVTSFWTQEAKLNGSFPPYNLSKNLDSTAFNLKLAIAGFGPEDISVSVEDNHLIIKGDAETLTLDAGNTYVHKGIAERSFTRSFTLGDYVEVKDVSYKNGILDVYMELVLPEHKKPKLFQITNK
jgi:molecular chaperone IbpA